ncbi:glutamine--fructose-6-phosphate transaminase (isomerizing) [Anaerobranca gottschalkii]|uniref:Glutamine--fructose-6-phosphate aminotransferase [isomerizing] n=1 Tax=Anaerobranca gottschalkii DSM 13577 TaxID=1120990 RepID=A0A1I0CMI0_9FIRM|nr:glutamine--fructose-6-phosphate transaminase (isomerizing) [Anaerobranca gottschalkii]SET20693.1 glutamine--fructose-6-phosphate transaminase [Anaerobranca gottschalkii DSM 13577]
MCGIVGYIGDKQAAPILFEGLSKLEYRGYDSAGIAVVEKGLLAVEKKEGRLQGLEDIAKDKFTATVGIGHTRWATHGKPSDVNSHPHLDSDEEIAVVHNGIIENYLALKEMLIDKGHKFRSETDTEVVPHLIKEFYKGDLLAAVKEAVKHLEGAYALVVLHKDEPYRLICVRKDSPLVIGLGEGENFIASDIPAIIQYTKKTLILDDNEIAVVTKEKVEVMDKVGNPVDKKVLVVDWDPVAAEKDGYPHFMLKEIHEQPTALRNTLKDRIEGDRVNLDYLNLSPEYLKGLRNISIVACGTAYHAGLIGKELIEGLLRIPVEVSVASEFRYRNPLVDEKTLVIVVSQSGETADTLAALRESKRRGAKVLAITNVKGSSVAREADFMFHTVAGPEIAVASTKAYTTQLLGFYLITLYFGQLLGKEMPKELYSGLKELPVLAEKVINETEKRIESLIKPFEGWGDCFFIGRSLDWHVAEEGALKLKEISYIHAEAYAAGELKHGTLALIEKDIPVIALATQLEVYEKTISNIKEVKAREGYVIALVQEGDTETAKSVDQVLEIPKVPSLLTPILTVLPLQLISYYVAVARGCDVDKPRNLAKSVTVE